MSSFYIDKLFFQVYKKSIRFLHEINYMIVYMIYSTENAIQETRILFLSLD